MTKKVCDLCGGEIYIDNKELGISLMTSLITTANTFKHSPAPEDSAAWQKKRSEE
jgi:hypothetical protein